MRKKTWNSSNLRSVRKKTNKETTSISPSRHAWIDRPFLLSIPMDWNRSSWRQKSPPKHPTTLSAHLRDGTNLLTTSKPAGGSDKGSGGKKMVPTKKSVEFRRWNCLKTCESTMIGPKSCIHEHMTSTWTFRACSPWAKPEICTWNGKGVMPSVDVFEWYLLYLVYVRIPIYIYIILHIYDISFNRGFRKKS